MPRMKWILEDNGIVLTATLHNPIGVVFKIRPDGKKGGSASQVFVGDTSRWGEPQVYLVAATHTDHPPDSDDAKAEAIKTFQRWAMDVFIATASDGRGNWLYGLEPDND